MKDQRGVVYLETLVAFLPVFLFFLATLQIADLSAAHIIVRHAATVAARAAVVVMPDDGRYYNDEDNQKLHAFDGLRRQDIEHAADLILRANPRLDNAPSNVVVGFQSPPNPPPPSPNRFGCPAGQQGPCLSRDEVLAEAFRSQTAGELLDTSTKAEGDWGMREKLDALVTAKYRCMIRFFCPRDFTMVATASLLYQGARYTYEAWPDSIRSDNRPGATPAAPVGPPGQIPGGSPNHGNAPGGQSPTDPNPNAPPASPPANPSTLPDDAVAAQTPNPPAASGSSATNPNSSRPSLVARPPSDDSSQSASTAVVAGRSDNRAAASSGTRDGRRTTNDDADHDSSQVATAHTTTQGTAPDNDPQDGRTASDANTSNPARGSAPTRGPPATTTNTQTTTPNSVVAGSAHETDSDGLALASNSNALQPSTASIIASRDRSQTARTGTNASGRTSTPRNAAELRGALPSNLRNIPIVHDPSLQGSSVQVHYTQDNNGVITGIEVRVGPAAQARHITDHVNTVRAMQRMQGLRGRARLLLAQVGAWISGRPDIRPGSLAWETRREIEKLNVIIDARTRALRDASLTDEQAAELQQELDAYSDQLAYHQAAIADITNEPGRGYVAAHGPDSSVLQQHFAAVRNLLANGNVSQRTEARGEHNAAMHMLRESRDPNSPWYGFEMARGFESGHGFDQIWVRRENGQIVEIVIVEAKGRNLRSGRAANLGSTASMGPQMSRTWVYGTVLQEMHRTPADVALGNLITDAMRNGPPPAVYGVVVTGAHVWSGQSDVGNRAHPSQSFPSSLQPPPNVPVDPTRNAGVYHNTTRQRTAAAPARGPAPTRGPASASATSTANTPQNSP